MFGTVQKLPSLRRDDYQVVLTLMLYEDEGVGEDEPWGDGPVRRHLTNVFALSDARAVDLRVGSPVDCYQHSRVEAEGPEDEDDNAIATQLDSPGTLVTKMDARPVYGLVKLGHSRFIAFCTMIRSGRWPRMSPTSTRTVAHPACPGDLSECREHEARTLVCSRV